MQLHATTRRGASKRRTADNILNQQTWGSQATLGVFVELFSVVQKQLLVLLAVQFLQDSANAVINAIINAIINAN